MIIIAIVVVIAAAISIFRKQGGSRRSRIHFRGSIIAVPYGVMEGLADM